MGAKVVVGKKRNKPYGEHEDKHVTSKEEEGFDDETKLLRTIFIGNLPLKTKIPRKELITSNAKEQINHNASVHAYIVFKSEQSAEAALVHNMVVVGGNHILVHSACPPRKKLMGDDAPHYDNKRTIIVGNLPYDAKDEEIYQLFCGHNSLESKVEVVRVIKHPHTRAGKGIAYVLFETREAANLALKKCDLKLRDRELRLSPANLTSLFAVASRTKAYSVDRIRRFLCHTRV